MDKIIFLDLDGPIINTPCYYLDSMASLHRTVLNTQALGYVVNLAKLAKAKIVTNSTHNSHDSEDANGVKHNLKEDLIKWMVPEELFHEDWCTTYPYPEGSKFSEHTDARRLRAIDQWMEKNGKADWIAFDDDPFVQGTLAARLMLVNFERGIDRELYYKACKFWNIDPEAGGLIL